MFRVRERVDQEIAGGMRWAFREACIGAGVYLPVDGPIAGTMYRVPEFHMVQLGPPTVLRVRMLPGTLPEQIARAGRLVAPHLGGVALRVRDRGHGWCDVTILSSDPLLEDVLLLEQEGAAGHQLLLGRGEDGDELRLSHPVDLPHILVQGQTRSGKSTFLYSLLVQLARHRDVIVAGVDPSGITLRPFLGTRHEPWITLGLSNLVAVEKTLATLVAEMETRLAAMPVLSDVLPLGPDHPLVAVILDEWPGTLRALDAGDLKSGKIVRSLVARLLAESHKVGFRVIMAAQRAEAQLIGAAERAQAGGRLSFRVDSVDSVKLLHADGVDLAAEHVNAPPGVALCTWPGRSLTRIRGPYLTYRDYALAVVAAA